MLNPCFDMITITKPGECAHTINSCIIHNYSLFYSFYPFSPGYQDGGRLVYIHDHLLPYTTQLESNDGSYNSKIWIKLGRNLLICYAYLQHTNSNFISNMTTDPIKVLDADIDNYNLLFPGYKVAIIRDLNVHCTATLDRGLPDTRIDTHGRSLLDLAQNQNLRIPNSTAPWNLGSILIRTEVLFIIDYTITSITMEVSITIHNFSYLSKHAPIQITTKIELKALKTHHTQ
jgi:hypothetical protein